MTIEKKTSGSCVELKLSGWLDTVTSPELGEAVNALDDSVKELVLDCAELEYISSAGLRVLLSAHKLMAKKGGMKVKNAGEDIMEIFEVTGFSYILDIE